MQGNRPDSVDLGEVTRPDKRWNLLVKQVVLRPSINRVHSPEHGPGGFPVYLGFLVCCGIQNDDPVDAIALSDHQCGGTGQGPCAPPGAFSIGTFPANEIVSVAAAIGHFLNGFG